MDKEEYAKKFGRWIETNEIVIECDNRESGDYAVIMFGNVISRRGYKFEVWKAEGQKSYHIHLRDIPLIDKLSPEQNKKYKELFMEKYLNQLKEQYGFDKEEWLKDFDTKLCGKHRIAEENKPHYKYGTIKKLIETFNPEIINKAEKDLYPLALQEKRRERKVIVGNDIYSRIVGQISIIDMAKRFGFKVRGNMAVCKFHADSKPSMTLNDDKGLFYCFGCLQGGNLVDFYALCKKHKFIEGENESK